MANKKHKFGVLVITLVFAMATVGCDNDTDTPHVGADFFGTWRSAGGEVVTISADRLEFSGSMQHYRIENLAWVLRENGGHSLAAGYTRGFLIIGTLTGNDRGAAPQRVRGSGATGVSGGIGETVLDFWYIHTDRQRLDWGAWVCNDNFGSNAIGWSIFTRQ